MSSNYIHFVIAYEFVLVCPCTFFRAPVLALVELHPSLSSGTSSENFALQYVQRTSCITLPFPAIASARTLADLEFLFIFFEAFFFLFPVFQAETIFISLRMLLIFSYTENTLAFQLRFLAGLALIFCFSKSVWVIYLQAV